MMSINIHRHPFYRLRRHFWIFLFSVYYTTVQFGKKWPIKQKLRGGGGAGSRSSGNSSTK